MLAALTVRDIVLIENATLEFAPGLNVLTGETGAGKSILLDALGLASGGRGGGRAAVRPGAQQGSATAVFELEPDHAANAVLAEQELKSGDEIVLRRTLSQDGRTRAFVNDQAVGVALLKDVGALLLEVHGQADDRGLFDPGTHRALLDSFAGNGAVSAETAKRFDEWQQACAAEAQCQRLADEAGRDADYVRAAADELSALAPRPGEEESLAAERALMMNAARIAEDVAAAQEALAGERGAQAGLAIALKRIGRIDAAARELLVPAQAALDQAYAQSEEARRELDAFLARLELDPRELERKEERLFALRAAARKYAVPVDNLADVLRDFEARREAIAGGGAGLKAAAEAVRQARRLYDAAAAALSTVRADAARALEAAVANELGPLKLGHARFRVALATFEAPSRQGMESVAFEIATVEGAAFGPLARIASGGELARVSLALKVALAEASPPAVLVFDEVDRGVGGAVADAVGVRLQRLAATTQVLLVTHSPQVAARAARHFRIARKGDTTRVELLDDAARQEEVARMLAGASVTDEARAAARRLLNEAVPPKKLRKRA
ncbi:MAG: DNA repair protein RecN [Alphaproteobacteria bacterium]|nr:DNA repair protein RecN [Alphaproteobacteria bacterium]MBV9693368.1 DNA repair protein RecN [Alphaproteobacteria bacterium]